MSEQSPNPEGQQQQTPSPEGGGEQQPGGENETFDAEYVKKLRAESAKYRTEAKANADAAKRLAEIEEANKTEAQKTADRLAAAEKDAADARREALKFKIASKFQIGDEDADLFLTGDDETSMTKQAERLAARTGERKKQGNRVPQEGANSNAAPNDERTFVRDLFGKGG